MRFLCFGVGAIGTYIGGSLALDGQSVAFVEKAEVAEMVRKKGLRLSIGGEEKTIPDPEIYVDLGQALASGAFDLALLAIKSYDTQAFVENLIPYKAAMPPILCLQNGVENEGRLAEVLGVDRVIAGTVTSAVGRRDAGDIILEKLRGVGVASDLVFARSVVAAMDHAGLLARIYENARSLKWSKMLTNLLANANSAILNMTPAEIYADRDLYRLEMRQLREALAVMAALHIPVIDLPGTPSKGLSLAARYLPTALSQPVLMGVLGKGRGGKMPSFYLDLHNGRGKSEVDYLNGAVVRAGETVGVKTTVNAGLNRLLLGLTNGDIAMKEFDHNPKKLLVEVFKE